MIVLFTILPIVVVLVAIFIIITTIATATKEFNKNTSDHVIQDAGQELKKAGQSIVDGISELVTTPVSKCPNCGATTTEVNQKKCPYCGGVLPRKSRFSKNKEEK